MRKPDRLAAGFLAAQESGFLMRTCPHHPGPVLRLGDQTICWGAQAQALLGQQIRDLACADGLAVLLFEAGAPLPLPGWTGQNGLQDPGRADALLEILEGSYLVAYGWRGRRGWLRIGADPAMASGHWQLDLRS